LSGNFEGCPRSITIARVAASLLNPRADITISNKEGMTMKFTWGLALVGLLVAPLSWAQTSGAPEQELIKLENTWRQAVVTRDKVALQRLYAAEYQSIDQEGAVWDKAEDIAIDTTGGSRLASFTLDDLKVQLYGNVAVVTGRNTSQGTLLGRAAKGQYRFTDVFVKRDARWQCVTSQVTPITEE
jgi:ketosteroid isomerase-like protein